MGVCICFIFCCTLLCVRSGVAVVLKGKRGLVALLNLSSSCLVVVGRLFLAVPQSCLRFVIVVFPDHTHLLFKRSSFISPTMITLFVTSKAFSMFYLGHQRRLHQMC